MSSSLPTLHLLCGKIASGKSTLAARLAAAPSSVRLSEDQLLARLYPGEIATLADYARCAARLREAMTPVVQDLLRAGVSVVLDFQANTPAVRRWMRGLVEGTGARCVLHHLEADDALCKARLRARNASGAHEYQVDEATFDLFTGYFVPPGAEEGFEVLVHEQMQE
jgi:predicted kinase